MPTAPLNVGYYDTGLIPIYRPNIVTMSGNVTIGLDGIRASRLAGLDILVLNAGQVDQFGDYNANLTFWAPDLRAAVADGMVLILHDEAIKQGSQLVPGGENIRFVRDLTDTETIELPNDVHPITNGLGGYISDTSLDGPVPYRKSLTLGWADASTLPAGAEILVTRDDPNHVVMFGYAYGKGYVIYSTINVARMVGDEPGIAETGTATGYFVNTIQYAQSWLTDTTAPTITSNGGVDTATASVVENTTLVTTLTADQMVGLTISGGEDAGLFEIRNGNELHFKAAPDYEQLPQDYYPFDYHVQVTATNVHGATDVQSFTVEISNAFGSPVTGAGVLVGTGEEELLMGGAGGDRLEGLGGGDYLFGRGGADTMIGGDGNDLYIVEDATDKVIEAVGGGRDSVSTTLSRYALSANVELGLIDSSVPAVLTGNGLANELRTVGAARLDGGAGDDILEGADRNDTLIGGAGADRLLGGYGNDVLYVDASDGYVTGDDGIDTIIVQGVEGVDRELASVGIERFTGGVGNDTATAAGGTDSVTLSGGAGDDVLTGSDAGDLLIGGAGNDSLDGGAGDDRVTFDAADGLVLGGDGTDTAIVEGPAGVTLDMVANSFERFTGGIGADAASGLASAVVLRLAGGAGKDTLTGGDVADQIDGGAGDDVLDGSFGGDSLSGAAGNDSLVGGDGADLLTGGAGIDSLDGGAGDDRLMIDSDDEAVNGGAGTDTAIVQGTARVGLDMVASSIERFIGGDGNDVATAMGSTVGVVVSGGGGDDSLIGGNGADQLTGGAGADLLYGGEGNDRLIFDALDIFVLGSSGADTAIVQGSSGVVLDMASMQIEHFVGGTGADRVTAQGSGTDSSLSGNADNDTLVGGGGADSLTGGDGSDSLDGGAGDDRLYVDALDSSVQGGPGTDTVVVQGADGVSLELASASIERFTGGAGNDTAYVVASSFAVSMGGGAGHDTLSGGEGADTLGGGIGNDVLSGGAGIDRLDSGAGNDTLVGGAGNDSLTGGAGQDVFSIADGLDTITDFNSADDSIQLDRAGFPEAVVWPGLGLDPMELFQGKPAAASGGTHFIYDQSAGKLYYDADGAGTGAAAMQIALISNKAALAADDLHLV